MVAIIYTLANIVLLAVILSYFLAFSFSRSKSVLALLLFFIIDFVIKIILVTDLWSVVFKQSDRVFNEGALIRGSLLLLVTIFLFYTTWNTESAKVLDNDVKTGAKQKLKKKEIID